MNDAMPADVRAEAERVLAEINAKGLLPAGYRFELNTDPIEPDWWTVAKLNPATRLVFLMGDGAWALDQLSRQAMRAEARGARVRGRLRTSDAFIEWASGVTVRYVHVHGAGGMHGYSGPAELFVQPGYTLGAALEYLRVINAVAPREYVDRATEKAKTQ